MTACEPCKHYNRVQVAAYAGKGVKKARGTIMAYQTTKDVGHPYEVIGFMGCDADAGDEAAVLRAMLYHAADMGADGLLLSAQGIAAESLHPEAEKIDVRWGWMTMVGNGQNRLFRAQAIRFKAQ
jgi:hypothetical protein